jgi:hypothetical protein
MNPIEGAVFAASVSATIAYYVGRILQLSQSTAEEAKREAANKVLEDVPEVGPILFATAVYNHKAPLTAGRFKWIKCGSCPWAHELQPGELKLCLCELYAKPHFHQVCKECGYRALVRTVDDIDKPTKLELANDKNPCECGNSQAKTDKLPSGLDAWKCTLCGKLRPKLIGGVTKVELGDVL